jgi:acyl carrier protein
MTNIAVGRSVDYGATVLKKAERAPDEVIAEVTVRELLAEVLGLAQDEVSGFAESTALFGALPEFDSMAVANFLTALEERLGVLIEDDDVDAEDFASFGSLIAFVERLRSR